MKNYIYLLQFLFCITALVMSSCIADEEITHQNIKYLPSVNSSTQPSMNVLNEIKEFNNVFNSRSNSSLNFNNAVTASYEGYEDIELVIIPSTSDEKLYSVYTYKNDELIENTFSLENHENSMIVSNAFGEVEINIDNNIIIDSNFKMYQSNQRMSYGCEGIGEGYLECTNAVQDQLVDAVGAVGAIAFDVGCSLWVVCRAAYVVACSAYVAADCPQ